ncbi:hypothetical protein AXF42_Ash007231 [Apostasia shenzhenica]|uniref:Uncharacterized protein n=1 Tax=Apostasia shenzhenica TaxID=1088818 RepID=A0A2I0B9M7_9ASPA|nr:hypothetical protein AXF42_Ash007231 [Apostasia shenzhenica]
MARNLCYWCEEKYVPGHKCSKRRSNNIILVEEEPAGEETVNSQEALREPAIEEDTAEDSTFTAHLSLQAVTGIPTYSTMAVPDQLGKRRIFIDSGSTQLCGSCSSEGYGTVVVTSRDLIVEILSALALEKLRA